MILTESTFDNIVVESVGEEGTKKLYLKGIFLEAEQKNRNGRIYKRDEIERAAMKINESARQGRHVLGHLDHPPTLDIRLEDVSHKIVEMTMQGNNAIGKAEVLSMHPKGKILEGLILSGVNVGVSSRGTGEVDPNTHIVENYEIVTVDAVATPSAINAYPQSITEALEMYQRGELVGELAEAVLHDKKAQEYFKKELLRFIRNTYNG